MASAETEDGICETNLALLAKFLKLVRDETIRICALPGVEVRCIDRYAPLAPSAHALADVRTR